MDICAMMMMMMMMMVMIIIIIMMMIMIMIMTMTATKLNVCWSIGMPVCGFPARFANEVVRSMQAKLLVSDNTLSTHVRPRQRSDVPSKYSLAKRHRLSWISGSSFSAWQHLWRYSTTGCILVTTGQGNWMLAKHKQDWTLPPKLAPILMTALNTCQRQPTSAGRVAQECATCRDVHVHDILKPALHFPSHK